MHTWTKILGITLLTAFATPLMAQETANDDAAAETEEAAPNPLAVSMGEEETKVGAIYPKSEHGDWELRCVKAPEGQKDPCQLYQLLQDQNGNSVAEINVFPLNDGQAAAGATIVTPLETLLTEGIGLSIDGGKVRKFPFSWCSAIGCFSRLGFTNDDVNAFKRGINANLSIVPVIAPDQKVNLLVSLKGFTAGFDAVVAEATE